MLTERLAQEGNWLFRYRSFLPLVMLAPVIWSLLQLRNYVGDSHTVQSLWGAACCLVSWLGYAVRVTTVGFVPGGTSGRNTTSQRATELNTTGWYSLTRNPLYLGNFLIGLGIIAAWLDPLLIVVYTGLFWLYYERIVAREEEFLREKFGAPYADWAARTPVFIPALRKWTPPAYPFCWRTVLRREYTAVLLIGFAFAAVDLAVHWIVDRRLSVDAGWLIHLGACCVCFVTLRTLKKRTTLLRVPGR